MTLPGVITQVEDARQTSAPRLALATPFIVGELQRGLEAPILVRSMRDLVRFGGARTTDSAPTHDWLDAYWHEGGSAAYVTPLRGSAGAAATTTLNDGGAQPGIVVTAKEKGTWGNALSISVTLATSAAADDVIDTAASHGFKAGDVVQFPTLTGGTGLTASTNYYVISTNLGTTTFQVSTTPGGSAATFSADITAGTVAKVTGLQVTVAADGTDFSVSVRLAGALVESSGNVADGAGAAAWAAGSSRYVSITDGAGGDPAAVTNRGLAAGDDDFDGVTQIDIDAARDRFGPELGPGVYVFPGRTSTTVQLAAAEAADGRNRIVRADLPPTSNVSTLTAHLATLAASEFADYLDPLLPPLTAPGLTTASSRTIAASALRTAAEARNDAAGISPNQTAAGSWAIARWFSAPSLTWSDDDLETLNDAGGNVVRVVDGQLKVYGLRTADVTNPAGIVLGTARLRMAIREIARFVGEKYVFGEFDAGGVTLGNLRGEIRSAALTRYGSSLQPLPDDPSETLGIQAEIVPGDTPGTHVLEIVVLFLPSGSAEVVRITISRLVAA